MNSVSETKTVEFLDPPDQSPFDKNQYRLIRLSNGIRTLLISPYDGTATSKATLTDVESADEYLSAGALVVDVGSSSDPPDVQGMAHFLEHLVFMGSEKFPEENELSDLVQNAGGDCNANTTDEITNFCTSARGKYFDAVLDRFSQMFKAPLITKDAMRRERHAVDSEFSLASSRDFTRSSQVLYSLGTENHPSRLFPWGNAKTLIEDVDENTLHQKVHEFFKRHYSAHRMFLCLKAAQPLDSLQVLAVRHFDDIPSNNLPGNDFTSITHLNAFQSKFHEKVYFVKAFNDVKFISFTWCVEAQTKLYRTKPFAYITKVLSDTASGGLSSFLMNKRWCTSLDATCYPQDLFSLFRITIDLSDDGFRHLDDVIEATFAYLKFLKQTGPNERLFREYQTIAENSFRFANERTALSAVWHYARNLRFYSSKDVLNGDILFYEYNPGAIQRAIDVLSTRSFNIMVTSQQKYNENIQFDLKEQWFGTEYTEANIPDKWNTIWESVQPFNEFSLPAPNRMIADDFTIFYDQNHPAPTYPTKIFENDVCELWFRQDDKFLLPQAHCYFYFTTPLALSSTKNTCLLQLYENLLRFQLKEKLASAKVADIHYRINTIEKGLVVKVNGFNQKLILIVDTITKEMKLLIDNVDDDKIRTLVDEHISELDQKEPYEVVDELNNALLCAHSIPTFETKRQWRQIRMDDLKTFCRDLCTQMKIIALMQGNVTEEIARSIMQTTLANLDCGKIDNPNSMNLRVLKVPVGAHYLRTKSTDPKNCGIQNYYQIGSKTLRTTIMTDLLRSISSQLAYNILRTAEQLGYTVFFRKKVNSRALGYAITVESKATDFSTEYIDERIEAFRTELLSIIEKMPIAEFEQCKAMVMATVLSKDNSMEQEMDRNWLQVASGLFKFDRNIKEAEIIPTITKEEFVQFYRDHFGANERKLSIQVMPLSDDTGNNDGLVYVDLVKPNAGTLIRDIDAFKNKLEVHPPPD